MEEILENEGIEVRGLTCEQIGTEVGLDISGCTVKRALEKMEYSKCVASRKDRVNRQTTEKGFNMRGLCFRDI
jgi:hypothetical protein